MQAEVRRAWLMVGRAVGIGIAAGLAMSFLIEQLPRRGAWWAMLAMVGVIMIWLVAQMFWLRKQMREMADLEARWNELPRDHQQ